MNKYVERLYNGIWKENPIFVQMLGLCPTLAVTTSAINGVGMGLSTTAVLIAAIVVNCIILGRAEAYAMKNGPILSAFDGIGMGLGFTVALALIGSFRELLGAGTIFGIQIMPASYQPISIFILAPGAFFVLACLTALQNRLKMPCATNGSVKEKKKGGCCSGDCLSCAGHDAEVKKEQEEK